MEHPIITNDLAKWRYQEMLDDAAAERYARAVEAYNHPESTKNVLTNWLNEFKLWAKTSRRAASA
jgi:hypothetical protein